MEIPQADLRTWAKKSRWLHVNEAVTPSGRQDTFLTPAGFLLAIIYDLKGNTHSIMDLLHPQQAQTSPLNPFRSKG